MIDKDKGKGKDQATRTKSAEYGGSSTASGIGVKNKSGSSAEGPYQILKGTWKEMEGIAKRKLDRNSVEDNDLAFELYTKRSEKVLEQNGIEINPGNTYALHVYGPTGGVNFLKKIKANPTGLAKDGMSAEVIKGNKAFFFDKQGNPRTNSDSYNTLSSRVGGSSDPGRVTLEKNDQKAQILNQQAQAQYANQVEGESTDEMIQAAQKKPEEEQQPQEEQAPEEQAPIVQGPPSAIEKESFNKGFLYNGTKNDKNLIIPESDMSLSGDVQKTKTFAFGGSIIDPKKGAATRQDSINLKEDSLRLLKDYQSKGYVKSNVKFPENDLDKSLSAIQSRKGTTEVIRGGVRKAEKYNPSEYRTEINENQYRQRESANGVLNMDVTPALYDKRVKPTSFLNLMGKEAGTWNDGVSVPYYGDMEISPAKPEVKPVQTYAPTKRPLATIPQPQKIVSQVQQPAIDQSRRSSQYAERPQGFVRDNTRVGSSFSGVDPRISRKANSFAGGGEMNNGLLNDFNEGGTHEENPNGGIPQGISPEGQMNTVEEGETKMGNYIFSDRLKLDDKDVENLYLPKETKGMTYAEASKYINDFLEENPFDIIIKRTAKGQLDSLKIGNDRAKRYKEQEEDIVNGTDMDPEKIMKFSGTVNPNQEEQRPEEDFEKNPEEQAQQEQVQHAWGGATDMDPNAGVGYEFGKSNIASSSPGNNASEAGSPGAGAYVGAAGALLDMGATAFKKYDTNNLDTPIGKANTGMAIAGGAVKGAAAGAAFGPWGAAIGGTLGGIAGVIGSGKQNKAANVQDINITSNNFNKTWSSDAKDTMDSAYGGNIKHASGGRMINGEWVEGDPNDDLMTKELAGQYFKSKGLDSTGNVIPSYTFSKSAGFKDLTDKSVQSKFGEKESVFKMRGRNPLSYAGLVGDAANYLRSTKEKPRHIQSELMSKYSTPNYFDEAIIENKMNQEMNNRSQAILATSGGSASAARAMSMAGNSEVNKLKSDSYFKMAEVNNGIRDRDNAENQRIQDANVNTRNMDYQANLQEQDYVQGRKEKARDNMFRTVASVGKEISDSNELYNITGGYDANGNYLKDRSFSETWKEAKNYLSGRHSDGGPLLNIFNKMNEETPEAAHLKRIKQKFN